MKGGQPRCRQVIYAMHHCLCIKLIQQKKSTGFVLRGIMPIVFILSTPFTEHGILRALLISNVILSHQHGFTGVSS
jgi:multisubunit Na+/H+ antiporter MnhG subunit